MTDLEQDPIFALGPKLDYHLSRYGLGDDPLAKSKAKVLASRAMKSYDPSQGASFDTWLDRSLQPLSRFKRERSFAVQLPERAILESFSVRSAEADFEERNGRLPDMRELAEEAKIPMKKLASLRKTVRPQLSEASLAGVSPTADMEDDKLDEALSSIWGESDATDREILEMKTGFGGRHKPMSAVEVAGRLGLSPVQVSRRSARISAKLDELLELLDR